MNRAPTCDPWSQVNVGGLKTVVCFSFEGFEENVIFHQRKTTKIENYIDFIY